MILALLAPQSAWATEVTGQLRGECVDASGIPVPGVTITATGPNVAGAPTATSDDEGRFLFPSLPPGPYIVTATHSAFLPYRATGLLVVTGGAVTLHIQMRPATGGETVIIEDKAPAVDTQRVSTGVVLSRETMRDIPSDGRSYQGVVGLTPGVTGGGNPHSQGGFSDSNQFYLDGVNSTDPITGTFSLNMNYDAIEEVQVVTGGMDAEYGRSMGGAINIVTRSGGNEFHGDAQLLYSDDTITAYKPLEGELPDENYQNGQIALNLGGPIVKDRLWFFASLEGDSYVHATPIDPSIERPDDVALLPRDFKSIYYFGKLTWTPNASNRIWIQTQGDPTSIKNTEQSAYTLPEGETTQNQGGYIISLGHLLTQGAQGVLQTQLYYQKSNIMFFSNECQGTSVADLPDCIRNLPDAWIGSNPGDFTGGQFPYGEVSFRYRSSVNSSYTRYFDFLGHHQAKVGITGERLQLDDIFPGATNVVYNTASGDTLDLDTYVPDVLYNYGSEFEAHLVGYLGSAYLQDVWNPVERLTLRPGVRFDYASLLNDVGENVFSQGTVAPRFGAAWDASGDGKTNLHASYGRFYETGILDVADRMHGNAPGLTVYGWDEETQDWGTEPIYASSTYNIIFDDIKNPYSDALSLGLSRDVGNGWGLDLTGTYKYFQNFWEDDEVNLIWNAEGTDIIGTRNGVDESIYRIRTPDEAYNKYSDLAVSVTRQFSDGFSMMGSYTWSRAYGTNGSEGATGIFDNPEQYKYETGLLDYDRTHVLKIFGSTRKPMALKISDNMGLGYLWGWNFLLESGVPYRKVYYDNWNQGWYNYQEVQDGTYRTQALSKLDLKAGVTLAVRETTFDLTLECFNVFNDRTVESVDTTYGNESGTGVYTDDNGDVLWGTPIGRQDPRYLQVGLRGEF